jgi:hypothetical protein
MSEPAAAPPASPGRRENVLTHKLGPLPTWAWVAIAGAGILIWRWYSSSHNAQTAASQQGATTAPDSTAANTVPQFVNQTYVTTSPPAATDTGTASTPTNPAPVGSSTEPKPTTTLPGGWHYPAPTNLKIFNKAAKGIQLSWDAVTGPSGQHPANYTIATYNSKGKLVNEHGTVGGNTNTAEYGPGGKGLPKGTYRTQVWANGGPVAPPGATVQYTLSA